MFAAGLGMEIQIVIGISASLVTALTAGCATYSYSRQI